MFQASALSRAPARCHTARPHLGRINSTPMLAVLHHHRPPMHLQQHACRPLMPSLARPWQARRQAAMPALQAAAAPNAIETAIRSELGMESTRLPETIRQRVEAAIQRNRYRATVGEVAALAGIKLSEAETALKALAYDSQATLQVSSDGDVVYCFRPDFQAAMRNKSLSLRAKPFFQKAKNWALLAVRTAFGLTLFASIILTTIAISVVLMSSGRDEDNRSGGRGGNGNGGGGGSVFYFPSTFDLLFYFSPDSRRQRARDNDGSMSLPEAIFSFVFGDGDPNADYEEQRWRALGRFIQARNGVVTAEEMAPYLDPQPSPPGSSLPGPDEAFVLPALIKFGGEAFVDEDGHLLYRFPSLQKTVLQREVLGRPLRRAWGWAARGSGAAEDLDDDPLPRPQFEQPWQMTAAEPSQVFGAVGLGLLNFVGVATLAGLLADPRTSVVLVREGLAWIPAVLPFLGAYAVSFFGIPGVRLLRNNLANAGVERRNAARELAAERVAEPNASLQRKLERARAAGERKLITQRDIVFSTDRETGAQVEEEKLKAFDEQLEAGAEGRGGKAAWGREGAKGREGGKGSGAGPGAGAQGGSWPWGVGSGGAAPRRSVSMRSRDENDGW